MFLFGRIYRYVREKMYADNPDIEEINDLKTQIQNTPNTPKTPLLNWPSFGEPGTNSEFNWNNFNMIRNWMLRTMRRKR